MAHASLWYAMTEDPHHHAISLFCNYPNNPALDAGHLILKIAQRTTNTGQSMRLSRATLLRLALWLRTPEITHPLALTFLEAVPIGQFGLDVLEVLRPTEDTVAFKITHRAADFPQAAVAVVGVPAAIRLADEIADWDRQLISAGK
jgi:hypothetical protein